MGTVIGISPGSRVIGIAVFRNGILIDSRSRIYTGALSKKKVKKMLADMETLFCKWQADMVAIKLNHPSRESEWLNVLVNGMVNVSDAKDIALQTYTIWDLKEKFGYANAGELCQHLSIEFPELTDAQNASAVLADYHHHLKLFEAVAVGKLAVQEARKTY